MRAELPVITTVPDLVARHPDLAGAWVVGVDARDVDLDWISADVSGAVFARCSLHGGTIETLTASGAVVLPLMPDLPFDPYRAWLYSNSELMDGYLPGHPDTTFSARIGVACVVMQEPLTVLAKGIHDACIDAALMRFLTELGALVVGIMGSHTTPRGTPDYMAVASLGRELTREGFVVATGGGPGLMEAANFGAWLAREPDDALDAAIAVLVDAPRYDVDPPAYLERALEVRKRWPNGSTNLGVPTWLYVDEPVNQFASHIAKYFQNSIRENGLLAIARGGVVFTPGGSGTLQELFTDAAQNDYTMYGVQSPMVLMGSEYRDGALSDAVAALQALADRGGWGHLVRVVDSPSAAFGAIRELRSPDLVVPRPPLRKR
ncbi:MAG: Rossmann fold nucleotide-binding protein [Acidimicrobiia bacterium]|nr:Rossmann fold nucleotide-binding protein [Acidimicrobiia bacterium]